MKKNKKFLFIIFILFLLIYCDNSMISDTFLIFENMFAVSPTFTSNDSKIAFIYKYYYGYDEHKYEDGSFIRAGDALCYIDLYGNNLEVIEIKSEYSIFINSFCLSPDNNFIVFSASKSPVYSSSSLYIIPSNGGSPIELINNNDYLYNYSPTWSPDGEWIYFLRYNDYNETSIWKIKPNGEDLIKLDIDLKKHILSIDCSNNGNYLVMDYENSNSLTDIMISSIDGEFKCYVAEGLSYKRSPSFSPDDKFICFSHDYSLWITPIDNSFSPLMITENPSLTADIHSNFSPEGQWIVFERYQIGIYKVKVPDEFLPK